MNELKIKSTCLSTFPPSEKLADVIHNGPNPCGIPHLVKLGIDATSDRLHLGHLVPLLVAQAIGKLNPNTEVKIVIGTFTGSIGDPSGSEKTRPQLDRADVENNAFNIEKQLVKIFGDSFEILWNGDWLDEVGAISLIDLMSRFTTTRLLSRKNFLERLSKGNAVHAHELIVPILQGIDSCNIEPTIEIGGIDQTFNFDITREVMVAWGKIPQKCILAPIIVGTDGKKMSKSKGNCVFLDDNPEVIFGKVMSISDESMSDWLEVFDVEDAEMEINPLDRKKALAFCIVKFLHGTDPANFAKDHFELTVQEKKNPENMKEVPAGSIIEVIRSIRDVSKSEARRLIMNGGVTIDGEAVIGIIGDVQPGTVVKVGKRDFGKVIPCS